MMKADIFYKTVPGRMLCRVLQKAGIFRMAAWFLQTRASKCMIPWYIRKNSIDMSPYTGQTYESFATFFSRKREGIQYETDSDVLISPCDGLLSVYAVTEDFTVPMKGSVYALDDLVPDRSAAGMLQGGLCLVFRLEASDYHHFCCFDDGVITETHYVPGQLHSVQPIAQRGIPVFRLNRRWWSIIKTKHFGTAVQIEVGAMLVGGVSFSAGKTPFFRGDEMGCFRLAGSTIILLLNKAVREQFVLCKSMAPAAEGTKEIRVHMGEAVGTVNGLKNKTEGADCCRNGVLVFPGLQERGGSLPLPDSLARLSEQTDTFPCC